MTLMDKTKFPTKSPKVSIIHQARVIASFALMGAVTAGVLSGFIAHPSDDIRLFGAVIGGAAAIFAHLFHAL